jgi:hypothetical protein
VSTDTVSPGESIYKVPNRATHEISKKTGVKGFFFLANELTHLVHLGCIVMYAGTLFRMLLSRNIGRTSAQSRIVRWRVSNLLKSRAQRKCFGSGRDKSTSRSKRRMKGVV